MCQAEVLKVLEKEKRWMTVKEIEEKVGVKGVSVNRCLKQMFKYGEVFRKRKEIRWAAPYLYKPK